MSRLLAGLRFVLPSACLLLGLAGSAAAQPTFSKAFSPGTAGPSTVTTLVFEITNGAASPAESLAVTDNLPAGVTVADPLFVSSSCGGTVTATAGGGTITLAGGQVGAMSTCQIRVDVMSPGAAGTSTNTSGDLTSTLGNSGPATDDLTVDVGRPAFSKSFASDMVRLGETTSLTFTIDNSLNPSLESNLSFSDTLPSGLRVASPSNLVNTCNGTPTAASGSQLVSLLGGFVLAGEMCTISVDVTAVGVGTFVNRSGELSFFGGSSGIATDGISVVVDELALVKELVDDPTPPGGTVTLEFRLTNLNRTDSATNLTFTDDLDATLSGLVATDTPLADPCGAGSTLTGTSSLTLTGAILAPEESCTFQVTLAVPAGAAPGSYPNTTSEVSGDVGGTPTTGAAATDTLVVQEEPVLTKTFLSSPVGAGDTTIAEFTIENSSATHAASGIGFTDSLGDFMSGVTVVSLPTTGFCGGGSSATVTSFGGSQDSLVISNASLGPGADCTFQVEFLIPEAAAGGTYTNTTSSVMATVDGVAVVGDPASADLVVAPAVAVVKVFEGDPVTPGSTVDLAFSLSFDENASDDATGITFTDDLDASLPGLVAVSPGFPVAGACGPGSSLDLDVGTQVLTLTGGTLAPGATCDFVVTLQVPAATAPGAYPNSTSTVTADVGGLPTTGRPAQDDLDVAALLFSKEFVDDPTFAGDQVTLRFSLENLSATEAATAIQFSDDVDANLAGLMPVTVPPTPCNGTLASVPGNTLAFSGGSLAAAESCTFDVVLQVPVGADAGDYANQTSNLQFTYDGAPVVQDPAQDVLQVVEPLGFAKEFIGDPVGPGDTVSLQFTLSNLTADDTATGLTFTDDLSAALAGLQATGTPLADPCGAGSSLTGTSTLTLTGGTVAAGASCTFSVTLQVPADPDTSTPAINQTSDLSGTVGGVAVTAPGATDELELFVIDLQKSFDGPTGATGTAVLSFTLTNESSTDAFGGLAFTDDLNAVLAGLVATDTPLVAPCGEGSQLTGTSSLTFSGGVLGPGESCNFQVTVSVPADALPGLYPNTTSGVSENGLPVGDGAADDLQIEPPPSFAKAFAPALVAPGESSTLTFTLDNSGSAIAATDLTFTDDLPAGLVVATPANGSSTCGGTLTAAPGSGTVSLTGGTVAAGATCTISVDVVAASVGRYDNTSGELTSSSGTSGTASDTLEVESELSLVKQFDDPALRGALVDLTFTLANGLVTPVTDLSFTDDLGATLAGLQSESGTLTGVCGAGSELSGTSVLTFSGGSLGVGESCSFTVSVRVPGDAPTGSYVNTTSALAGVTDGGPVSGPAVTDSLEVVFLSFTKEFGADRVEAGATVEIAFTLSNPDPVRTATDVTFVDDLDAFVPGATAVGLPMSDVCGTGSMLSGESEVTLTGGVLGPGETCVVTVLVQIPADNTGGTFTNVTSPLVAMVDGSVAEGAPGEVAEASIQIGANVLQIPTLSEWMLMLLALSLGLVGAWKVRI